VTLLTRPFGLPRVLDVEIPRLRLVRQLEGRWDRPVTLLVAGPGFGKTTVLAQAVRAHQAAPRGIDVWVSCEAAYEDPVCFATALLDAMSAGGRSRGSGRRAAPGPRDVVGALIQWAPLEVCLLLDDVHEIPAGSAGAALLSEAAIFVPGITGLRRVTLEAAASGCAIARPRGVETQPELAAAAVGRLADDAALGEREGAAARADAETQSFAIVAEELERLYGTLGARRRRRRPAEPLADRPWIVADLHMHTSWSHDCSIDAAELVDHAESEGLGAIAVTDHNVFGGALEAVDLARGRELVVIPGEEVKTDTQGEVIGLFLEKEIPRGLSFADTIAAIREQDGIVYVPHPFDRLHAIPDPRTLHRHLADIDVLEVYNARLLFEGYNDEALRFARKYNLTMGAGSDAHVLQGVGTGALRMRAFADPEEFLLSLRTAEILRRPKSLAYLQSLKWVAQVKERVR